MTKKEIDISKNVVVLLGEDLLTERESERWITQLLPSGKTNTNFVTFDAAEDDGNSIANEAATISMFCPKKVLVVRGIERGTGDLFRELIATTKAGNPSVNLILLGTGYPSKGSDKKDVDAFKRVLKKYGYSHTFTKKGFSGQRFLQELADEQDIKIHPRAIAQLVRDCASPSILQNELEKLACFVDVDSQIMPKHVSQLCEVTADGDIWELTGTIISRDMNSSLAILHRLLREEVSPHYLLRMISWQVRHLTTLQEHLDRRQSLGTYWQRSHSRDQAIALLKKNPTRAHLILPRLLEVNRAFNSSKAGAEHHIHSLVLSLCID